MKLLPSNGGLLPLSCPFLWRRGRFAFPFAFCGWWRWWPCCCLWYLGHLHQWRHLWALAFAFALGRAFPFSGAFALAFSRGCQGFWICQFLHVGCTVWHWHLWLGAARDRASCHCSHGGIRRRFTLGFHRRSRGSQPGAGFNGHGLSRYASSRGVGWVHPFWHPCGTLMWGMGGIFTWLNHWTEKSCLWPIQPTPTPCTWCQCSVWH